MHIYKKGNTKMPVKLLLISLATYNVIHCSTNMLHNMYSEYYTDNTMQCHIYSWPVVFQPSCALHRLICMCTKITYSMYEKTRL